MQNKEIKVFVKENDKIYRRVLNKDQYNLNELNQIVLPKNHYSKGYIERIIDGIIWEEYPEYGSD